MSEINGAKALRPAEEELDTLKASKEEAEKMDENDRMDEDENEDVDEEDHNDETVPMAVMKPGWVFHGNIENPAPIYTICVHPDGTRFATGGADSRIKLWSTGPLKRLSQHDVEYDQKPSEKKSVQKEYKLLAELTHHTRPVNCLKFSRDGKLASGSDDKSVAIWHKLGISDLSFSSFSQAPSVENWTCKTILRGTTTEVHGVTWDPSSRRIASCHVDNTIVIWQAQTAQQLRVLRGHKGWVTGIEWDPKGRYLASQASDGMLMIWNVRDGVCVKKLRDPFESKTFGRTGGFRFDLNREVAFTRVSWSCDGKLLAACRGYQAETKDFISPVFSRGNWKQILNMTGHSLPTCVVKFAPLPLTDLDGKQTYVIATGGRDGCINVWRSNRVTSLLVFQKFFKQSVLDLAWTPDGTGLFACSHDGNMAYFGINLKDHLAVNIREGYRAIEAQQDESYNELDGYLEAPEVETIKARKKRPRNSEDASNSKRMKIPNILEPRIVSKTHGVEVRTQTDVKTRETLLSRMQIERKTASGKRRIQPVSTSRLESSSSSSFNGHSTSFPSQQQQPSVGQIQGNRTTQNLLAMRMAPQRRRTFLKPKAVGASLQCFVPQSDASGKEKPSRSRRMRSFISASGGQTVYVLEMEYCGKKAWAKAVSDKAVSLCASSNIIACGCKDNLVHLFSLTGSRLALPIVLPAPIYRISINPRGKDSRRANLVIITTNGHLRVFSISSILGECIKSTARCSFAHLLEKHRKQPIDITISENGLPEILFPDETKYIYDRMSQEWGRSATKQYWASTFNTLVDSTHSEDEKIRLASMENSISLEHTIDHLQDEMSVAIITGNKLRFRECLLSFTKHLALAARPPHENNDEDEELHGTEGSSKSEIVLGNSAYESLRDLTNRLLGPPEWRDGDPSWDPYIILGASSDVQYIERDDKKKESTMNSNNDIELDLTSTRQPNDSDIEFIEMKEEDTDVKIPAALDTQPERKKKNGNLNHIVIGKRKLLSEILPLIAEVPRMASFASLLDLKLQQAV